MFLNGLTHLENLMCTPVHVHTHSGLPKQTPQVCIHSKLYLLRLKVELGQCVGAWDCRAPSFTTVGMTIQMLEDTATVVAAWYSKQKHTYNNRYCRERQNTRINSSFTLIRK